jgi:hypothetical protein
MKGFGQPKPVVLKERALVREPVVIKPPPNHFTHELLRREPYYVTTTNQALQPDGFLSKGAQVLLLVRRKGARCHVADRRGRVVDVACSALRELTAPSR